MVSQAAWRNDGCPILARFLRKGGIPRNRPVTLLHLILLLAWWVEGFSVCVRLDFVLRGGTKFRGFSREAAQECSPQRQLWVNSEKRASPEGAQDEFSRTLFSAAINGIGIVVIAALAAEGRPFHTAPLSPPLNG
jgi:hypothetical protein